jgi:hypothetical protein
MIWSHKSSEYDNYGGSFSRVTPLASTPTSPPSSRAPLSWSAIPPKSACRLTRSPSLPRPAIRAVVSAAAW